MGSAALALTVAPHAGSSGKSSLTEDELQRRLKVAPKLAGEVYGLTLRQLQSEAARQGRIDAKATSLLSAVGLSLTVTLTFGGLLVSQSVKLSELGSDRLAFIRVLAYGAVLLGLGAGVFALRALRVQAHSMISEKALFDADALSVANGCVDEEVGLAAYQRFMTVHAWAVMRENAALLDAKASFIKHGQRLFLGFIVALSVICAFIMTSA